MLGCLYFLVEKNNNKKKRFLVAHERIPKIEDHNMVKNYCQYIKCLRFYVLIMVSFCPMNSGISVWSVPNLIRKNVILEQQVVFEFLLNDSIEGAGDI